jgi:hypothetical protein
MRNRLLAIVCNINWTYDYYQTMLCFVLFCCVLLQPNTTLRYQDKMFVYCKPSRLARALESLEKRDNWKKGKRKEDVTRSMTLWWQHNDNTMKQAKHTISSSSRMMMSFFLYSHNMTMMMMIVSWDFRPVIDPFVACCLWRPTRPLVDNGRFLQQYILVVGVMYIRNNNQPANKNNNSTRISLLLISLFYEEWMMVCYDDSNHSIFPWFLYYDDIAITRTIKNIISHFF